jgi:branched-chain amino acid transport system permease protein
MDTDALRKLGWVATAAVGILLLVYPLLVTNPYYARIGGLVLLSAISASAWNLVGGYAGQVSVGHSMFFGAGAYLPLLVYTQWELPPTVGIPLGVGIAVLLAVLIGTPTLRLQGHYFSMATIAAAELLRLVVTNWEFAGAAIGLRGPAVSRTPFDFAFRSVVPYYYLFLGVLAALLALVWRIERTRMGFYLRAIKAGERAARSLGVPARRYKLFALMISAAFTALAGSLYALWIGFVDPESGWGILVSVEMIIITALGGAGTLFGPLIGAAILIPLQNLSNVLFGGGGTGLTFLMYGGIIVLIARFEPGGLLEMWRLRIRPRLGRKSSAAGDPKSKRDHAAR